MKDNTSLLFGSIVGGMDERLRLKSASETVAREVDGEIVIITIIIQRVPNYSLYARVLLSWFRFGRKHRRKE